MLLNNKQKCTCKLYGQCFFKPLDEIFAYTPAIKNPTKNLVPDMSSMKEKTNVLQYKNMGGKSITIKTKKSVM